MKNLTIRLLVGLLLLLWSTPSLWAQQDGGTQNSEFNPSNPPEPEQAFYHKVTVSCTPANAAYVYGGGVYKEGTQRTIYYSSRSSDYKFKYWTLDGSEEPYSAERSFSYTVGKSDMHFVAHFDYIPVSPDDPKTDINGKYRLFLESDMSGACAFNIASGELRMAGDYIALKVSPNQGYQFLGWYEGDTQVSNALEFNYLMPNKKTTLTARFVYIFNPPSPNEPEHDESNNNVQNNPVGDVNRDMVVDVLDVVAIINRILNFDETTRALYDVNGDGVVDITDITIIIRILMSSL